MYQPQNERNKQANKECPTCFSTCFPPFAPLAVLQCPCSRFGEELMKEVFEAAKGEAPEGLRGTAELEELRSKLQIIESAFGGKGRRKRPEGGSVRSNESV